MENLLGIIFFIFGTLIGSFLNVVIIRYGTGMGLGGRSRCSSSGQILKWYELIPIVSFLIQGGRSRYTGAKLSWQYPLVEFLTGIAFVFCLFLSVNLLIFGDIWSFVTSFVFFSLVSVFSILISVYDIRHMIIPNQFVYPLIVLSFVSLFVSLNPLLVSFPSIQDFVAGPLVALPFVLMWFVSRGRWMGFADAKLGLIMGWFLGIAQGFFAVLLSFWIGALVGILVLIYFKMKKKTIKQIPFGPFLLTGLILTFLYNISIDTIISFFL